MALKLKALPHFRYSIRKNNLSEGPTRERLRLTHHVVLLIPFLLLLTPISASGLLLFPAQQQVTDKNNAPLRSDTIRTLELAKPLTEELSAGQIHSYQMTLTVGQYVRLIVEQQSINVSLAAFDSQGKKILVADAYSAGGTEEAVFITEVSGSYRIEVEGPDKNALPGHYQINVKEIRLATDKDKSLVIAHRIVSEAVVLDRQHTADSQRKAIEKYLESLEHWRAAADPAGEAVALYMIANAYLSLGDKQKALEFTTRGFPIAEAAANRSNPEERRDGLRAKAYTLDAMGRAHNDFGDRKKALELFNQALPLRRLANDKMGEANTLNNMAMAYGSMGEWPKALDLLTQVRVILRDLGNRRDEATMLNNMCVINTNLGQYKKALEFGKESVQISRELRNKEAEATALNNLGSVNSNLGEYQQALDFYNQALGIHKSLGDRPWEAVELHNIAWIYSTLGEPQKAIDFYTQALAIFRAVGNRPGEANTLNNIGVNYAEIGDYHRALEIHSQVLPIRRSIADVPGEANTLSNIGNCYAHLDDKQKALDYYSQALALQRKIGDRRNLSTTLKNMGGVYLDLGEGQRASDALIEGLELSRVIGDRNNEAGILSLIARLERDRGNLVEARTRIDEALSAVESLRANIKSQQLRATFLASFRKYYEFDVDLLMQLHKQRPDEGFDAAALEASEKGRARSLLELLTEAHAEIRQGVKPELVERELALRQEIANKAERQIRLLSGPHTDDRARDSGREMDALTNEYDQVLAEIRQTSPRYAALTQPQPLTLREIQSQVLDDDTTLLEYSLGEGRSFLWVVTLSSVTSFELPKRSQIEATARKLYDLITLSSQTVPNETPIQRRKRQEQADTEYPNVSTELSEMLLGPAASQLKKKRLLIVGEGILQYVPFAALPEPRHEHEKMKDQMPAKIADPYHSTFVPHPLVVDHEIVSLPSASVLAVLRKETGVRKQASKTVAVLADPVFDSRDPRLTNSNRIPTTNNSDNSLDDVKRSASEAGLLDFVRLRFSRQEADQIERLTPGNERFKALDFAASRATALGAQLAEYRIVHFATHGLINNQHPDLSGIVLSLVNEHGQPENGFVRLYDIYNMTLKADLVVLSSCQTALGKEIKGEGLVGLTRAFMYAGAPRVVASLWRVDDRATAKMMGSFYQGMLADGLRPAAALRAAQISMLKENRWRAPRYWAAFTLQGEWK